MRMFLCVSLLATVYVRLACAPAAANDEIVDSSREVAPTFSGVLEPGIRVDVSRVLASGVPLPKVDPSDGLPFFRPDPSKLVVEPESDPAAVDSETVP